MAKSAEFKRVPEAAFQPPAESVFDESAAQSPPPAEEATALASPLPEAPAPSAPEWLDLPEDRTKYPYDGREVFLTRDLETAERAQWIETRRYDARAMKWVPDGFWVAAHTRRRLYPHGAEPAAYRSAT